MAFECRINQRATPRTVERGIAMKLDGKASNPGLSVNPQIQRLQHVIELAQIVVDHVDGEIGRPLDRIHTQQAGDLEVGRGTIRLQSIDLNFTSALEVLGIHSSTERKQPGDGLVGNTHSEDGGDGKVVRRAVQSTLTFPSPAVSNPRFL